MALFPTMALALPLLLALLGSTPGLGAPGGGCGVPPSAWCQDWLTALRCGALGRCPRLGQGPPEVRRDPRGVDVNVCAMCQQIVDAIRGASSQSVVEMLIDQLVGLVCNRIPFVESVCRGLVTNLIHELLKEIQHLDSRQVCSTLALCLGGPEAVPVLEEPGSHQQDPEGAAVPALSPSLGSCARGPIF